MSVTDLKGTEIRYTPSQFRIKSPVGCFCYSTLGGSKIGSGAPPSRGGSQVQIFSIDTGLNCRAVQMLPRLCHMIELY